MAGSRPWRGRQGRSQNRSPLRGPNLRTQTLLLAITQVRLALGRKPLGFLRAPLRQRWSRRLRLRWCGSNCALASVARALPWGDDGWGTAAATPSSSWHPREPLPSRAERSEGSSSRERGFARSAGKRRICLRPPEQRSRRGGCLFPPGPSAEALCPPPPAPPRSGSSAPDSRSSALGCRQAGGTNPPTSPARGGGGGAGAKTGRIRGAPQLLPPAP